METNSLREEACKARASVSPSMTIAFEEEEEESGGPLDLE